MGRHRFCVNDYRRINAEVTIRIVISPPRIDDTWMFETEPMVLIRLERSGYWQVEVQPRNKEKRRQPSPEPGHLADLRWTEEIEKSFNSLNMAYDSVPVLTHPRTDKEFILDTDASNEGIGAVLSQKIGNEECVKSLTSARAWEPEGQDSSLGSKDCKNMTLKSSIEEEPLTEMQMRSLEDPVKGVAKTLHECRKKFGMETDISVFNN
ncbi:hypothetical protein AVEN_49464-1 [Araneus ventricosus]|uniref:Reverse transcriptase/retrotransposon-derived protein RNase H-like domain-containing protein n=1 Tax=Araneus ventricosus TaxID=182803 RepID=A0A4Y2CNT8_ARAVE|nr:hypothetical protein AVEN_49464-1 [Araneus ventricosus]